MEDIAYQQMADIEKENWYYRLRLEVIDDLLSNFLTQKHSGINSILDIGCGTGGSTRHLQKYGPVTGLEPSRLALDHIRNNHPYLKVMQGKIEDIPKLFSETKFDLITILGVLYHKAIENPSAAINIVSNSQKPGGIIIWNEAVHESIRRHHDKVVHCGRRFSPNEMKAILKSNGYQVLQARHLISWAYPVAFILSKFQKSDANDESSEQKPLHPILNYILLKASKLEWQLNRFLRIPFGVSYMILAIKR